MAHYEIVEATSCRAIPNWTHCRYCNKLINNGMFYVERVDGFRAEYCNECLHDEIKKLEKLIEEVKSKNERREYIIDTTKRLKIYCNHSTLTPTYFYQNIDTDGNIRGGDGQIETEKDIIEYYEKDGFINIRMEIVKND